MTSNELGAGHATKIDIMAKLKLINLFADIGSVECVASLLNYDREDAAKIGDPLAAGLLLRAESWLSDATRSGTNRFDPLHPAWLDMTGLKTRAI